MRHHSTAFALALALCGAACSGPPQQDSDRLPAALGAGSYAEVTSFGPNPGGYGMYLYTPPGLDAVEGAPAIIFFHGCTQQARDVRELGWEKMADARGFYLVYPQQPTANNPVSCFNWAGEHGDPANLVRGQGENQSVASMVGFLRDTRKVDPKRVYVAGFSAGGAMVAVMLATWPDLFAGGAINSGVPYRCATTVADAFSCQLSGRDRSPADWGQDVRAAFPGFSGPYPRLTIWQGTSDTTVVPMNQRELRDQWTNVHGLSQTPDEQDTIGGHARARYQQGGVTLVETVSISGMSHGVTVDPARGCGQTGAFAFDKGLCAAQLQTEFLLGGGGGSSGNPPVVIIDAPADGATVSGTVAVRGRASDEDDAVAAVELRVDGALRASLADPPPSFQLSWNAAAEASGVRQLSVTAVDRAGHRGSAALSVRVDGGGGSEESASGTCTAHYVAGRLDVPRYLACGRCHGYIGAVTLYRFGARWTDDAGGAGCMDR